MIRIDEPSRSSGGVLVTMAPPAMESDGVLDYICPGCGRLLATRMHRGQMIDLAIQCAPCGTVSIPPLQELRAAEATVWMGAGKAGITETLRVPGNKNIAGTIDDG